MKAFSLRTKRHLREVHDDPCFRTVLAALRSAVGRFFTPGTCFVPGGLFTFLAARGCVAGFGPAALGRSRAMA